MDSTFQAVVTAAVSNAKARQGLFGAAALADRIAAAIPLDIDREALAERLTMEAVRQGLPVSAAASAE